ncbi:MAG: hypothetical protein B6I22_05355 [Desulfobacteraceae bacterium 4572_123]|nr:MAG: hypothetical protein B6I22_05355 [Desulfobacteraceae bacterium 4572_123]
MLHKVSIAGLTIDPTSNTPIVVLKSDEDDRTVPIWIGLLEATSIAAVLQDIKFDRPMTHDLFKNFVTLHDMSVSGVEVVDIRNNTFYARINFICRDGNFSMDARPSDAIALALRFKAPIYVEDKIFDQPVPGKGKTEILDHSEEGKKWAEYLKNLSPDKFGKV